ncbi:MAG TPA: hypothetical protein VH439_14260 [Gemmatimonadales bacterium]|jgi:hypothetical protein
MRPTVPLRRALSDKNLLGHALSGDSWAPWRTLLIASMGEELTEQERITFKAITGREHEPGKPVKELVSVVGRRGGKTSAEGALAAYIGGLCDHSDVLAPGERGVLLCVALDREVAKIILDYCEATFQGSPILRQLIANRTQDALELTNGISIEVRTASFRRLRGPTYVAVIADELAFWCTDSVYANPDSESLAAIRPGLLTTHGPLILASSPYAKRGVLWDRYRTHYGPDGSPSILVAHGASRDFNPTLDPAEIERALEEDRPRNSAEYLAQFRSDIEGFVSLEVVEACVGGYRELGPRSDTTYRAFVDPSGGSQDSMTLAIAHKTPKPEEMIVVDAIREARPPFSPEAVVDEFATLCKLYHITKITGDHFGGEFVKEPFRKHGLDYVLAEQPKSDLYRDLLPRLNSGRILLPKSDRTVGQIVGLERRVSRAGKDSIDHGPHGHDDLANAVAGVAAATQVPYYDLTMGCGRENDERPPPTPGWKLAGFKSREEAEDYKARARAQYGRAVSFPWDGYPS